MKSLKAKKIIVSVISVIMVILVTIASFLFLPLNGDKNSEIWAKSDLFDLNNIASVEKKSDEEFKILMITDTQLWLNPSDNKATYEQIEALVQQTKPNLIVTVGDNVSGPTSRYLLKNLIKFMDSLEIPWAPVFGNHDNEIPMTTLNWQGDKFEDSEYCLFKKGPSNLYGCGNYVVNVTENGKVIKSLFFFDNGRYFEYPDGSNREIYMGYEQIAWYEWNVNGIGASQGNIVESMTFSHFAQPEFRDAVEKYGVYNEADKSYTIPSEYGNGKCAYLPGTAPVNSGFVEKCKELGSTKYIFCGHDHENAASIKIDSITYAYGIKTGPSPAPWNFAEETGGTVITISNSSEDFSVRIDNVVA